MDLLQLDIDNAGARTLRLRHPVSDEPLGTDDEPTTLTLYGADSNEFKRAEAAAKLKAIRQRAKKSDDIKSMSDEEIDDLASKVAKQEPEISSEMLARVTAGTNNLRLGSEEITPANIAGIYAKFSWVKEQADAFISDRANFMPRASKN